MDTIKKLIRCDLIMLLHSGKAAVIAPVVLLLLFCGIMILAGASFVAGTAFVVFGVSLVSLLLNTEKTSGCTPLFGILPAERQTVAAARFVLCGGILTAALILCALCMEIALAVMEQDTDAAQLFISLFGLDPERVSANTFHRFGFYGCFMVSLIITGTSLHSYFKNGLGSRKNSLLFLILKGYLVFISLTVLFMLLPSTKIPFISTAIFYIYSLISVMLQPAGGYPAVIMLLAFGYSWFVYCGVSAAIDYEKREL